MKTKIMKKEKPGYCERSQKVKGIDSGDQREHDFSRRNKQLYSINKDLFQFVGMPTPSKDIAAIRKKT